MNIKQIRELAAIVAENGLTSLELIQTDETVRIERAAAVQTVVSKSTAPQPEQPTPIETEQTQGAGVDFNRTHEVHSPLVGVFYSASAPGTAAFVTVGSRVHKGDVLCIVEAMKLMNEIPADRDGEVVDICVRDGDVVEFGQTLFKLC